MIPAIKIPTINGLAISVRSSPYAYFKPDTSLSDNFSLLLGATALWSPQPQPFASFIWLFLDIVLSVPKKF